MEEESGIVRRIDSGILLGAVGFLACLGAVLGSVPWPGRKPTEMNPNWMAFLSLHRSRSIPPATILHAVGHVKALRSMASWAGDPARLVYVPGKPRRGQRIQPSCSATVYGPVWAHQLCLGRRHDRRLEVLRPWPAGWGGILALRTGHHDLPCGTKVYRLTSRPLRASAPCWSAGSSRPSHGNLIMRVACRALRPTCRWRTFTWATGLGYPAADGYEWYIFARPATGDLDGIWPQLRRRAL